MFLFSLMEQCNGCLEGVDFCFCTVIAWIPAKKKLCGPNSQHLWLGVRYQVSFYMFPQELFGTVTNPDEEGEGSFKTFSSWLGAMLGLGMFSIKKRPRGIIWDYSVLWMMRTDEDVWYEILVLHGLWSVAFCHWICCCFFGLHWFLFLLFAEKNYATSYSARVICR